MNYKVSNNDLIQIATGEIRARVIMLNVEATRFGIMYGVINEMSEDEITQYVDTYSGLNGVYASEELAMAHAIASMSPVPTPFVAENAHRIDGEILNVANAHCDDNGAWIADFCFSQFKGTCKQAREVLGDLFDGTLSDDYKDAFLYINEYASRFADDSTLIHKNFRHSAKWWFTLKFSIAQKHWALFI